MESAAPPAPSDQIIGEYQITLFALGHRVVAALANFKTRRAFRLRVSPITLRYLKTMKVRQLTQKERRAVIDLAKELAGIFAQNADGLDRSRTFAAEHYRIAHEKGYMRLTLPREYGGWGADVYTFTLAQEELAQGCAGSALAINMHLAIQSELGYLLTPEQQKQVFSEAAEKKLTFAGGGTEAGIGGSWHSVTANAKRVKDGYILNGRKKFCSGASVADYFWNFYMLDDYKNHRLPIGVTPFLIPRNSSGLSVEQTWDAMGMRASGSDDLILNNVWVPESAVVGKPGRGFAQASARLYWSLFSEVANYLGVATVALRETIEYIRDRHEKYHGTRVAPGLENQLLIGEISAKLEAARTFLHETAKAFTTEDVERTGYTPKLIAQAAQSKFFATKTCIEVVDTMMQIFGGFGFLSEKPIERHYRDVRGGPFHPPRNVPTALSLIGRHLLGINLDPNFG